MLVTFGVIFCMVGIAYCCHRINVITNSSDKEKQDDQNKTYTRDDIFKDRFGD